jgi:hypothetical protein
VKPHPFILSILIALLLVLGTAPSPTHAQSAAPEPTTCSHTPQQIAGRMVLDGDHDALPDPEEGVPGITFTLANVQSGTTVLQTVTTDAEGCYRFNRALVAGGQLHRVSWSGMHPSNHLIHDPDNGTVAGTPNFLFIGGAGQPAETDVVYRSESVDPYITTCPFTDGSTDDVGGMVALDRNHNNRADPGEGIQGAVVTFAVANPTQVLVQSTTDANGCYALERRVLATEDISGNYLNGGDHGGDDISGNYLNGGDHGGDDISGNYLNGGDHRGDDISGNYLNGGDHSGDNISGNYRSGGDHGGDDISGNYLNGGSAGIQGCCNHLQEGEGDAPVGIQGCCNHRTPATTYMYIRAYIPEQYGGILPSYDPNGRQTENAFYEVFTTPNGGFETDFLLQDFSPTAVTVSAFGASPVAPAWMTFAVSGVILLGTTLVLFRRRVTVN